MKRRRRQPDAAAFLDSYSGMSVIGHGPSATVYGAVETESNRPVAVKIFQAESETADVVARELRASSRLHRTHPHILVPDRIGVDDEGHPVSVTDLCRTSMKVVIDEEGSVPASALADIGIKIAGALAEAHDRGVLHLNVKPQNILVTLMEEPVLTDFGAFSFRMSVSSLADRTPFASCHAAPELFEDGDLSPATDVYALASTLYQMLGGRAPFEPFGDESPASIILRILRDPVIPLSAGLVPYRLAQLVESGLAKDPADRPQGAGEFADELRAISAEEGWSAAVPTTRRPRTRDVRDGTSTESTPDGDSATGVDDRSTVPGVAEPGAAARNVVLPEGRRRGTMDRPPRRS